MGVGGLSGMVEVGLRMGPMGPRCMLKWTAGAIEGDGFWGRAAARMEARRTVRMRKTMVGVY